VVLTVDAVAFDRSSERRDMVDAIRIEL